MMLKRIASSVFVQAIVDSAKCIWKKIEDGSINIQYKFVILIIAISLLIGFAIPSGINISSRQMRYPIPPSLWVVYEMENYSLGGRVIPRPNIYFQNGLISRAARVLDIALESSQDSEGNTHATEAITFLLPDPNIVSRNNAPIRGVSSNIRIDQERINSLDETFIYCHYSIDYGEEKRIVYIGNSQFVPIGEWINLVWDFSGKVDKDTLVGLRNPKEETDKYFRELEDNLKASKLYYSWISRRLNEQWFYSMNSESSFEPNSIGNLRLTCNLTALQDIVGVIESPVRFTGNITIGNSYLYP